MPRLASEMPPDSEATITSQCRGVCLIVLNQYQTAANNFGLWKDYLYCPSHNPDATVAAEDLYHPHLSAILPQRAQAEEASLYTNRTVELLLDWQNSGSSAKSNNELNCLVKEVLLHPKFKLDKLSKFNAMHENQKADAIEEQSQLEYLQGFYHANIIIKVPSGSKDNTPQSFLIPGLYYHKITTLIQESFQNPIFFKFHLSPFKLQYIRSTLRLMEKQANTFTQKCTTPTSFWMCIPRSSTCKQMIQIASGKR